MRILMLTPYPPSPIRVRPYHLLRALAGRSHELTLVCPLHSPAEAADLRALGGLGVRTIGVPTSKGAALRACLRALPGGLPLQAAYELGPALVAALRAELVDGGYEVFHVEHIRAAQVALAAAAGLPEAPPILLDAVDSISLLFERTLRSSPRLGPRLLALLDLARTRRYEAAYAERFAGVVVTSPEDAWAIATLRAQIGAPAPPPAVVPNGVDTDYFAPSDGPREPATLIFSGKMSYHANQAAALFLLESIMPLVWRERPAVQVLIAGAGPGQAIRAHSADGRVTVTGYVPDLRPYMARATLAVAPICYGVGIQNKVLEAMASGVPVIAARQATRALAALPGRDLLVAEGADDFAQQILAALASPQLRRRLAARARDYVVRQHSWAASAAALECCYTKITLPKWIFSQG